MARCVVFAVGLVLVQRHVDGDMALNWALCVCFGIHVGLSDIKYGKDWRWFK